MSNFISLIQLAQIAGISRQAIEKAVRRQSSERHALWRGSRLVLRTFRGRGGRSGWSYEVRVDSLPADLQARFESLQSPVQLALKLDDAGAAEREFKHRVIAEAARHPPRSPERRVAIDAIVAAKHYHEGRVVPVSRRTAERWIADYVAGGLAALTRKKRKGAGESAVILTRLFDGAVKLDDATKHALSADLTRYIAGMVKAGESPSMLQIEAQQHLMEITRAAGFDPGADALKRLCAIPAHLISRHKDLRKVHRFKTDRKAHEDARSRILRSRVGLLPNDVWVMDVHPLDIPCRRDDGTIAYARGIATLDLATNRVRIDWVLCDKGKGITNRHVIAHFTATVAAWGAPRALYLDNGSEYRWAEFIGDALKLVDADGRRLVGDLAMWEERRSNIVRARAYNAPAKPIEGIFRVLEQKHFHVIPGWQGGDRQRKKTANVGREPAPYPGSFDELDGRLNRFTAIYNETPQFGHALGGKAPNDAERAAIVGGWQRVAVDEGTFLVAFSTPTVATVRQGRVKLKGLWTSRALQEYQSDTVTLLVPKYETYDRLPFRDEAGSFMGFLERETAYAIFDKAGAREAREREKASRRGIRALDHSAPDIDPVAEREKLFQTLPKPPEAPIGATLDASDEAKRIAEDKALTAAERRTKAEQDRAERDAKQAEWNAWHTAVTAKLVRKSKLPSMT